VLFAGLLDCRMASKAEKLNIVIVSDVHARIDRIHQLLDWLSEDDNVPVTDLLLVSGDIANRNMQAEDRGSESAIANTTAQMSLVLAELENVCARLVYVPGNHDSPKSYIEPLPSLSIHSCNAHGRQIRVLPDVVVVGVGGSTPVVYDDKPLEWSAFPYKSDEDLKAVMDRALRGPEPSTKDESLREAQKIMDSVNIAAKTVPHAIVDDEERLDSEKDFCILLTHQGAHLSNTSIDYVMGPLGPIYSGSPSISETIDKGPVIFKLSVHGHTHNARGANFMPRGTLNINPGALCEGNFATCTLVKRPDAPKWAVESVQLHSLPDIAVADELEA